MFQLSGAQYRVWGLGPFRVKGHRSSGSSDMRVETLCGAWLRALLKGSARFAALSSRQTRDFEHPENHVRQELLQSLVFKGQ